MRFIFNDKTDAVLKRFYQTFETTLDTQDYVAPKTNAFVYKFIGKFFRKSLRGVAKDTRNKMKRFKAEAKLNGLTLDEYLDILDAEEQQSAIEAAVDAEPEEVPEAEETGGECAQETAEEGENPSKAEEQEQTG